MGAAAVVTQVPIWTQKEFESSSVAEAETRARNRTSAEEKKNWNHASVTKFEKEVLEACNILGKQCPTLPFFLKLSGEQALLLEDENSTEYTPLCLPDSDPRFSANSIRLDPFAYESRNLFPGLVGFLVTCSEDQNLERKEKLRAAALALGKRRRVQIIFLSGMTW